MTSYKEAYKYPFIATEILSSKNRLMQGALFNNTNGENNILNLIKVLDNKEILNTTIPGYINKIFSSHIENELLFEILSKNNNEIFEILLKYIYHDSYRDLFYLIVNQTAKKGKLDNNDVIQKLIEKLLNYMNTYISKMNNNESSGIIIEIKDLIYNILYILIKFGENSEELFNIIIKKLSEGELFKELKSKLKEIDEEGNEEENAIKNNNNENAFYCINKLLVLFSNLLNIVLTKSENNKYSFYKYYLSTIIDPPYNPYEYEPSYSVNNNKDNNASEKEGEDANMKIETEDKNILLIDTSINYLKEIYSIFENKIEIIHDLNQSRIFSFYNKITDIIILIQIIEKKDNEKLDNFLNEVLIDLIQLIIDYPMCSIIHNKTLKIFEYITEYNFCIKKDNIIKYLLNYYNEKKINELITDDGVILNNKKESDNNIYLINILNLLEKQENKKIVEFLEKNNEKLLENEKMEPGEYVPKPDEEEIISKKKEDIHDSEAFIFTPKKVIEDSKKILKNLKQLDN